MTVPETHHYDAVVVGAGFAGLHLLHSMRERGMRVIGVEAAPEVGGTWYWNRYPGVRCDVESLDYSFGFHPDLEQEWTWSERYASGAEIRRYAEFVADRLDLRGMIRFDTCVESAIFDEPNGQWDVGLHDGETIRARLCVMATGCLSTTKMPDIDGIETFAGEIYHSGKWPVTGPDLGGKRVALIGTGSSGVQLAPELAAQADHLYVLQRTPNYIMPAHNRPLTEQENLEAKRNYRERRRIARQTRRGFPLPPTVTGRPATAYTPAEQLERLEAGWRHGGAIFTSVFDDTLTNPESNRVAAEFVRGKIRGIVEDPSVAEMLCPKDYPLAGKRPCVDTGYFETFNSSTVELIDLCETPVERVTATGIDVGERELDVDAIVLATGYDAITGSLNAIDIRGRDGVRLRDEWNENAMAYLGLMAADFPNLFIITGPGSPSVLCNMFVSIEQHVELLFTILDEAQRRGAEVIEANAEAQRSWGRHVADIANRTLLVTANSWYLGANVPGKARQFMPYAGGMAAFIEDCAKELGTTFDGFSWSSRRTGTTGSSTPA